MTDPTILNTAAETLLQALTDAAAQVVGWEPHAAVAAGEPSYDCDGIYVWLTNITPDVGDGGCVVALEVELTYSLAECVGTERDETSIFENASVNLDKIWGIYATLAASCCGDTSLLGANADNVELGALSLTTTDGGVTIYTGTVTAVLSTVTAT